MLLITLLLSGCAALDLAWLCARHPDPARVVGARDE